MEDFTKRFTGRAAVYSTSRPAYPAMVLDILRREAGFDREDVVADIGSGTGLLSRLFVENGNQVFGVEPNDEMRSFAEQNLKRYSNFVSVKGRAEDTGLGNLSVDLVTVGQALHWFDPEPTRKEFSRILRETGYLCIVYNDRNTTDQFMRQYDAIVQRYARNRAKVPDLTTGYLSEWFRNKSLREFTVPNEQYLDLEGLLGRMTSASYMPNKSDSQDYPRLRNDTTRLFESYSDNGKVRMLYDTRIFLGQMQDKEKGV